MTQEITRDMIRALNAGQLEQVSGWVQDEGKERVEKHRQETLAKIRELARSIEVAVKIEAKRGRPSRAASDPSATGASMRGIRRNAD